MIRSLRRLGTVLCGTLLLSNGVQAQSASEIRMAKQILGSLQEPSFRRNREFCGMIGLDEVGRVVASKPRRGRRDSCRPRDPREAEELIASYHTHGRYHPDIDSEWPSVGDVEGDMDEGVDGWISTPGGRLWFVDGQTGVSRQICGVGCLPRHPDFEEGPDGPPPRRITLDQLIDFQER